MSPSITGPRRNMQTASVAKNVSTLPTYLFAKVDGQKLYEVRESIDEIDYVDWYGATTGRYDLAISLAGSEPKHVYSTIKKVREIDGVKSTSSFIPLEGYTRKEIEDWEDETSLGQVFLRTEGRFEEVLASLKKIPEVSEVLVVPGEWDLVATVRGSSYEDILKRSIEEISQIDGVSASETSFVYEPKWAE
jgi:DNA-binding Lrp family transcriptional regulator